MRYAIVFALCLLALAACTSDATGQSTSIMDRVRAQSAYAEQLSQQDVAQDIAWDEYEVQDVMTQETFTIAELETPILVKNFAVWCPKCMAQHEEFRDYDGRVLSLNIDPNEDARIVRDYVNEHDFSWMFAVASEEMTASLIQEFGPRIISTPTTPVILVCEDGHRFLPDGFKSVEDLNEYVAQGCDQSA